MIFKILGIDASLTGTGVICLCGDGSKLGDELELHERLETKFKGVERLLHIESKLKNIVDKCHVDLIIIEGYAYAAQNQAHQIGELGGVIRTMLHKRNLPWIEVTPQQVKKFATGKGNCKKDLVLMNVYKKWGVEFTNSDEADAYVLAKIGQALLSEDNNGDDELYKYQQEVIKELRKKYEKVLRKCKGWLVC